MPLPSQYRSPCTDVARIINPAPSPPDATAYSPLLRMPRTTRNVSRCSLLRPALHPIPHGVALHPIIAPLPSSHAAALQIIAHLRSASKAFPGIECMRL